MGLVAVFKFLLNEGVSSGTEFKQWPWWSSLSIDKTYSY